MNFSIEQIEKAKTAGSAEELLKMAHDNGIELSESEARDYFEKIGREGELADDELENVAGGGCGDTTEQRYVVCAVAGCGFRSGKKYDYSGANEPPALFTDHERYLGIKVASPHHPFFKWEENADSAAKE